MRRTDRPRRALLGIALIGMLSWAACAATSQPLWADSISSQERSVAFGNLPDDARRSLVPLSEIFYNRITSRRFNSRATFEDPSMRQFFPTIEAYSDYYAGLVDALDRANIRFNRPTRVELLGIETDPAGSIYLSLQFTGRNDLPLRWWNATLSRRDQWRWQDGRWWVVPGKV